MKSILLPLFLVCSFFVFGQDTLELYYEINKFVLTPNQKGKLEKHIKGKSIQEVSIIGYADYLGQDEKNQKLSLNRAKTVQQFLEKKNLKVRSVQGKGTSGPDRNDSKGIQEYRRVDLLFVYEEKKQEVVEKETGSDSLQNQILDLEVGDKLVLKNFNFIPGRHFLLAESKPELARLIDIMLENPNLKIELHGHICCEVTHEDGWDIDARNYGLSTNRAKYIYQQLVNYGVAADRMTYKGFGRTAPLYPLELSEAEKSANRRVEILILEK